MGCKLHDGERNIPGWSLVPVSLLEQSSCSADNRGGRKTNGVVVSAAEGPSKWPADLPERSEEVELFVFPASRRKVLLAVLGSEEDLIRRGRPSLQKSTLFSSYCRELWKIW